MKSTATLESSGVESAKGLATAEMSSAETMAEEERNQKGTGHLSPMALATTWFVCPASSPCAFDDVSLRARGRPQNS
jgi:hypothetical protein